MSDTAVRFEKRVPAGPAARVAAESWSVQARRCPTAVERLVADASVLIYFNLGPGERGVYREDGPSERRARTAWVMGPRDRPIEVAKETEDSDIVGVRLHPSAAGAVLGVPARELANRMVDLEPLWGDYVERIRERLAHAPDPGHRLAVVEAEVARRIRSGERDRVADRAARVCEVLDERKPASVASVADAMGLTHRRIIGLLTEQVGLRPAELRRVLRFQRSLGCVATGKPTWARVAHRVGYADQSHLIREFRRLAGMSPEEYLRRRSPVGKGFVRLVMAG